MTTLKEKTDKKVMNHYHSRMEDIQLLYGSHFPKDRATVIKQLLDVGQELEADATPEQIEEAISTAACEYGLCFDYVKPDTWTDQTEGYFRYLLSWGGPSEEFRFYVLPVADGQQCTPYKIEFWWMDWGESGRYSLMNNSLSATAEEGNVTLQQLDEQALLLSVFNWFQEIGATTIDQR